MLRRIINWNRRASRRFDGWLAKDYRIDGNLHFVEQVVPQYLSAGQCVYDIGAGRHPCVSLETKSRLALKVVGLDIDPNELEAAPAGAYDELHCADIRTFRGKGDADLIICQALLEHVQNVAEAFESIASILKPGGCALIFVPSRNAAFARLNLILPHRLKRAVLFAVFPEARRGQGFVSFYDRCTPADFHQLSKSNQLQVEREWLFWSSTYFTFLAPMHVAWRAMQRLYKLIAGRQAAETFSMVLRKPC